MKIAQTSKHNSNNYYCALTCSLLARSWHSRSATCRAKCKRWGLRGFLRMCRRSPRYSSYSGCLFFILLIGNSTLAALGRQDLVPPSFLLICLSTFYLVFSYGSAAFTGITLYRRLDERGRWQDNQQWASNFTSFFLIGFCAYLSSLLVLSLLLFPILAPQGIEKLINFSTFRSVSPAVGALLACSWLTRNAFEWRRFAIYLGATSVILAAIAGFISFLISALNNEPDPLGQIAFDAGQGFVAGLAMGFLGEVTRTYLTKSALSREPRGDQSQPAATPSGLLEPGGRIAF